MLAASIVVSWCQYLQVPLRIFSFLRGKSSGLVVSSEFARPPVRQERLRCLCLLSLASLILAGDLLNLQ